MVTREPTLRKIRRTLGNFSGEVLKLTGGDAELILVRQRRFDHGPFYSSYRLRGIGDTVYYNNRAAPQEERRVTFEHRAGCADGQEEPRLGRGAFP